MGDGKWDLRDGGYMIYVSSLLMPSRVARFQNLYSCIVPLQKEKETDSEIDTEDGAKTEMERGI